MNAQASRITSLTIVYSPVYLDADQRKHQSSASLAFVWGIHRGPVNSSHKGPVKRKMFPFDDVIMITVITHSRSYLSPNCQDDRVCRATSHLFGSHETCIQKINISPRDHIWEAFWLCPIRLECRWAAAHHHSAGRDQFRYAPSQWETSLHCNDVSNCVHSFIHSFIHSFMCTCDYENLYFVIFYCTLLENKLTTTLQTYYIAGPYCPNPMPSTSWWHHEKETLSALLALCARNSPVTGEFPLQRPVTQSFDVFFDLRWNKLLSKQSWGWWSETPSRPLWRITMTS